jgi:hypothetical protein
MSFTTRIIKTLESLRSQINAHENKTANVHGVADFTIVATTANISDSISAHSSDTTNIHGIVDTSALALIDSPTFTGTPSAPTASAATSTTQIATTAFVRTEVSSLVDSAPSTLDTLNELAAALGDDPNFATTVTNSIASKQDSIPLQNSAPSTPSTGDLWVDNTDPLKPILKVYNGSLWVTAGSSITADDDQIILASRVFS